MHLLVYTEQVSWRLNDKFYSRVGVLYNLKANVKVFFSKKKVKLP